MAVKLVTDSTVSLTKEEQEKYDISKVTLFIVSEGVSTPEVEMDYFEYYERLRDLDNLPTTSQPTTASFIEAFTTALDKGDDVLAVLVSAGLSGTVEGAETARAHIESQRPDAVGRIAIVNSQSNGMGLYYPLMEAAKLAKDGADLETCRQRAEFVTSCTRFLFAPTSLEHLRKGGRLGRASAMLGSALKMFPILGPDKWTGAVHVYAKVRTYPKALMTIKDKMLEDAEISGGLKALCVHYIAEKAEAENFLEKVVQPAVNIRASLEPIAPTVGTHVGPAVGIAYQMFNPVLKEDLQGMGLVGGAASKARERIQEIRSNVSGKMDELGRPGK
ncbi:MAG: DegV family protein [Coriobacteriia bacterium]|nr:DegV family protein [Coriobacteriia bacterium]